MFIDRRDPNPMKDQEDIQIYYKKTQEQRLYQLLTAVDDKKEPIKRDILKKDHLPTVEMAYATIRSRVAIVNILKSGPSDNDSTKIGLGLATTTYHREQRFDPEKRKINRGFIALIAK
ncbi:hypothetical protein HanIR_Chr04g0182491 [Helianthus annuus]|nr:hypothetical protein HanIR_Chr04g0182491 [Helianthus annuus]